MARPKKQVSTMTALEKADAVLSKNKAEEFEKKKELRKKIIDFAETGSLHQLTEINSEINRLTKRRVIL